MLLLTALTVIPIGVSAQGRRAASAEDQARERALSLFAESATAYREGRFSDAATLLSEAYELHPEPILLYNLARALEADGRLVEARTAYQDFLESSPEAEQAAPSRRRLEVIEGLIAERDAREVTEAVDTSSSGEEAVEVAPAPPASTGPDLLGPALTLSIGGAVAIAGSVLLGVASSTHAAAVTEPVHLNAARLEREAYALRDAGAVTLAIGGAVAVAGVVWLAVSLGQGSSESSVALRVGPSSLELAGTF